MAGLAFPESGEHLSYYSFHARNYEQYNLANTLFRDSPISEWADERLEDYVDVIVPKHMYVVRPGEGDQHHVAWVEHTGIRNTGDYIEPYSVHHVVCDCVAEHVSGDGRVEALYECPDVNNVLKSRAIQLGEELRVGDILDVEPDEENNGRPRFTAQSREMLKRSVFSLLATDYKSPEEWLANMRSGLLLVSAIATAVQQRRAAVLPVLDELRLEGTVEHDDITIRLGVMPSIGLVEQRDTERLRCVGNEKFSGVAWVDDARAKLTYDTTYEFKDRS